MVRLQSVIPMSVNDVNKMSIPSHTNYQFFRRSYVGKIIKHLAGSNNLCARFPIDAKCTLYQRRNSIQSRRAISAEMLDEVSD